MTTVILLPWLLGHRLLRSEVWSTHRHRRDTWGSEVSWTGIERLSRWGETLTRIIERGWLEFHNGWIQRTASVATWLEVLTLDLHASVNSERNDSELENLSWNTFGD